MDRQDAEMMIIDRLKRGPVVVTQGKRITDVFDLGGITSTQAKRLMGSLCFKQAKVHRTPSRDWRGRKVGVVYRLADNTLPLAAR